MSRERLVAQGLRFTRDVKATKACPQDHTWLLDSALSERLLESMLLARHLDLLAHELRAEGRGHYTIASAGHEANVVLGALTHPGDPTMLHYRSAAAQIERARQVPSVDSVTDIALSLVAASSEPLCSGRHKAFGSKALGIIPQTSTIASHLPRAIGLAFAIERRARLGQAGPEHPTAIAVVSFGDASLNHSTLQGALNALSFNVHQRLKLPLFLVCEDNQLGISVRTPPDWVATRLKAQPHLSYYSADAWQLDQVYRSAEAAIAHTRQTRLPAVLHLSCRRLLGHAGSDVDNNYRSRLELEEAEARDPVLSAAVACVRAGILSGAQVLDLDARASERVAKAASVARASVGLSSRASVMAPLALDTKARAPRRVPASEATNIDATPRVDDTPRTLAQGINLALARILDEYPEALVFGEDVARKGGVYGVTKGLFERAGPARVFNTLLDEQSILGLALGAATLGMFPVPEIQYLAYLHNAEDQLRGEAASLRFFSNGAYDNPMILRIAGLAYQKGFGGHFHNDNSLAVLRDIPGIIVGVPARADDAQAMYRAAEDLVLAERQVVVFVEPIALYHQRNLTDADDGAWLAPAASQAARLDEARVYDPAFSDLCLISYGNGVRLSLAASRELRQKHGVFARTLDLRWLKPLPFEHVLHMLADVGSALIVDECRGTGSVSEELMARLTERDPNLRLARVVAADSFVPLGEAADLVLVSQAEIVGAALELGRARPHRNT